MKIGFECSRVKTAVQQGSTMCNSILKSHYRTVFPRSANESIIPAIASCDRVQLMQQQQQLWQPVISVASSVLYRRCGLHFRIVTAMRYTPTKVVILHHCHYVYLYSVTIRASLLLWTADHSSDPTVKLRDKWCGGVLMIGLTGTPSSNRPL